MMKLLKTLSLLLTLGITACSGREEKIPIRILLLPKFEIGEMSGDDPGEAQYYYENFFQDCEEYEIKGGYDNHKLYVKDGLALYVTGMSKVNAALSTQAVLNDERFDFSKAYVISVGCSGGAIEQCVMGDVVVASGIVDNELGYSTDDREAVQHPYNWFRNSSHDEYAHYHLNEKLVSKAYDLIRDYKPSTTENARKAMSNTFANAEWATRDPQVVKGISVTGDEYWKGLSNHKLAEYKIDNYGCDDPYVQTEMEDIAIATTLKRYGLFDRFLSIRSIVNVDVFINDLTPQELWTDADILENDSLEFLDVFPVAMQNDYECVRMIIDAILADEFE